MITPKSSTPALTAAASARTFLFVPGNRPERYIKAVNSAADAVVLDLEDAVPSDQKSEARRAITGEWASLQAQKKPVVVRINGPQLDAGREDLQWLSELNFCPVVMVAKANGADTLRLVGEVRPDAWLMPLIESAEGYARLGEIASVQNVLRLVLGHIDFMADAGIQCATDQRELDPLRFSMAMQTRLHGLSSPVDGVTVDIDDDALLRADTSRALRFGFGGKLCIHPRQIEAVHAAFAPTPEDVDWAQRVLEGNRQAGGAAFQLDGQMVDAPVVIQAQRILERSGK